MLKNDAMSQLAQLKNSIRETRDIAQGTVRGTSGRFGFVVLDDGREAFLPPDAMQRVFPGDRVEVEVKDAGKGKGSSKLEAELEKLISSELTEFVGQYVVRGQGHFAQPDMPQFNRWIFLPPKHRGKAADGDFLRCKITRHPFEFEGKAQAKVIERIGDLSQLGIEHTYTVARFDLPQGWSDAELAEAQSVAAALPELGAEREDMTALPFVTIDSLETQDMDDALYAERRDNGWTLFAAIADPGSLIASGSALDRAALARAQTVYLPGESLTMLPPELSHTSFSLVAGELRPALVCRMNIAADGSISAYDFTEAMIRSRQKLSYEGVAAHTLGQTSDIDPELQPLIAILFELAQARLSHRRAHALVMQEQPDYALVLNDQRKIERIEKRERNNGQMIVEEAMLATNCCAGEILAKHSGGLISSHGGLREERLDDARTLVAESAPALADSDISSLAGYRELISTLTQDPSQAANQSALRRMLRPGELSGDDLPHLGMGLRHYATVTSPIRRYNDFHNHRVLKAIARNTATEAFPAAALESLRAQLQQGRQASRQMEQWLACQFMADKLEQTFEGQVVLINSQGLGVRLDDNGINGFVLLRTKTRKPVFDQLHLTMTLDDQSFHLDQTITVKVTGVDLERRRLELGLIEAPQTETPPSAEDV